MQNAPADSIVVDDAAMLSADRGTVIAGQCLAPLPGYLPAC